MFHRETTGTKIAQRILEIYRGRNMDMDFKNVQRRVYDALNVLSALCIIHKDRNRIHYKGILKNGEFSSQTGNPQKDENELKAIAEG